MNYPGRVIKKGESNTQLLQQIVAALKTKGYDDPALETVYDAAFASVIKLYQSQHSDTAGRPLRIDGEIGPLTWGSLFATPAPAMPALSPLAAETLKVANGEIGVTEQPPGSNSGPKVNAYLASVGLGPGYFWCMAFVYWCVKQAAQTLHQPVPIYKTGGCVESWNHTPTAQRLTAAAAKADPSLVTPGMIFIHDYGAGKGHTGIVVSASHGALVTIEGNADPAGGSNGLSVLKLNKRSVMDKSLKGFIRL